jgi:O-antigen/teichoic acid export membrane protein
MNGDGTSLGAAPDPVRSVLTGTATKYVLLAVNVALGVFMMPFTLHHLGTAQYGLWMLVASMTYYFQLLDLGYGSGLVRHLADADARGETTRANQILSTFVTVYSALGIAAAAGIIVIIFAVIPHFPNLPADQVPLAQGVLALMGIRITAGFPMTVFGAVTTARQRFAMNNTVAIAVAIANAAVTYVVLSAGYGLLMLVASTTAVGLSSYAAYAWTAHRAFPQLRIRPSSFSRNLVREVTAYSFYLFIIDIAVQIGFNLDNIVIGAVWGTSAVALYSVALRLADYQRQLCNQYNSLLFPVVVRFDASGRSGALRGVMLDGTRIAMMLVVGATVCVIGFGRPLIVHWMGPAFEPSVLPLYVLAAIGVVLVGQGPLGNVLLATGRHRLVAFASLGEALANLGLSLLLVRPLGIVGVAVGTAIPLVVANVFVLLPAACRQTGIGVGSFARDVLAAPAAGAVPAVFAVVLLRNLVPPSSLAMTVGEGAVTGLIYLTAVFAFGLDRSLRRRYLDHLRAAAGMLSLQKVRAAGI